MKKRFKLYFKQLFCRHKYRLGHILGMSKLLKRHSHRLPIMVYDKSFTRCYCIKCGKIFVEEEDNFNFNV